MRVVAVVLSLFFVASAHAQVFRCTNAAGKIEYSDAPCSQASKDARMVAPKVERTPAEIENEQLRRQLADEQNRRLRAESAERMERERAQQAPPPPAPVTGRTQADLQAERGNSIECERAKRDYEVILSSIGSKSRAPAAEAAMYSACGMRTPDRLTIINNNHPRRGTTSNCVTVGASLQCN